MSSNGEYSKKIVKILAQKTAISVPELVGALYDQRTDKKRLYAISRSIRGLEDAGLVEHTFSGQKEYARLTPEGKRKAHRITLEQEGMLAHTAWDGKWRMILLDLPESRKDERDALRYLLKKAGFVCLKNSVWISPFPYEYLFANIKKDFGLTTELMIIVTDQIDPETEKVFFGTMQ